MHDPKYQQWRAKIEARFSTMQIMQESAQLHRSPSGRYSLQIMEYTSGAQSWNYSRGVVRREETCAIITDVRRNYGHFWFAWVQRGEKEYLLCGEDYQGYNVIDLDAEENVLTFPQEAYDGMGFCWAAAHPSPSGDTIAVEGCYWACPSELVFYDFTNPMHSPLPELLRIEDLELAEGWFGDEFRFTIGEGEARRSCIWQRNSTSDI